jgi:hypothetical protein
MSELWSSRWLCVPLPAIALTLGLVLVAASVMDVLADHAIGSETQIAWQAQLLKVEEALVRGDLVAAERLWRDAYTAALKSVTGRAWWRPPIPTGRAGFREASIAKGHQTYLTALFRARSEGSVEGVLRTGRALRRARRPRRRRAVHPRRAAGRGQLARSADGGVRPADAQGSTTGG